MILLYSLISVIFYSVISATKSIDLGSILSAEATCCPQHATSQEGCVGETGSKCVWLEADDPIVAANPEGSQCLGESYVECKENDIDACCSPCCECEPVPPVEVPPGQTPQPVTAPVPPNCGPAPTTPAPITPAPVTPAPVTPAPVTPAPVTPAPVTPAPVTPAPVTPAPITPAPVTPAPVTPAPVTPAPVTPAPVTPAPVTPAPTTPAPVTPAPVTPAPVTPAPTTPAPVTPAPTTPAPVTPAPVTPAPVTPAPVTPAPVTPAPVTPAPVTPAPTTPAPVTPAPVTPAPVTPAPVTPAPVTPAPVTPAPVTPAPVTPAPVTPAPVTPSPTTLEPTPPPTCFEGQACMISGDPHTYMFNGDRHDFQGIPRINNQHYYIHPCHDANLDLIPIKVLGTHHNWGDRDVSGIDYMVVILTDDDGTMFYVFLSSSVSAYGVGGSGGISTKYDDNDAADMTGLEHASTTYLGNRFKINFYQVEANKRIWVKFTIDGKHEFKFYMAAQPYSYVAPRERMHFVWMSLPTVMKCEACGLCGNFKDPSTGTYVEELEACDGSYVEYRAGWSPTNQPEAYDPQGWTWEYNYVENTCGSYDITNNIPPEEEIVDPCPENMAALTAAECEAQMADESDCCDTIGWTLCANILASCKVDACVAANNDRNAIEGAVTDLMVAALEDLCTNDDLAPVANEIPEPELECPAGSMENTGHTGTFNNIDGCGMTGCGERFDQETPEECEALCRDTGGCHGFSFAPMGGDPNHLDHKVCTIYESGVATSEYGNNQIFCKLEHTTCSLHSYSMGDDNTFISLSQDGGQTFTDYKTTNGWDVPTSFKLGAGDGGITSNTILRYKVQNDWGPGGFAATLKLEQDQDTSKTATILTDGSYTNFKVVTSESTTVNFGVSSVFGTGTLGGKWNTGNYPQMDGSTQIIYDIDEQSYTTFQIDFKDFPAMLAHVGCYEVTATRVPTESPTPAPTSGCMLGENYAFEGSACIISGDPHTRMWNGNNHDFQGNPDVNNQHLYIAPCFGSSVSDMPLKVIGTHYRWGDRSVSGLEYFVIILEDTTKNEEFYVFFSSGIAGYLQVPAAGASTQFEDVEAQLTWLVSGSATSLGSGRYSVTYTQIAAGSKVSLSINIDGEVATIYMARQTNYIDGRWRMHYAQMKIPSSLKCHACGLCGNFKTPMTGLNVEYLETCSGGQVGFRAGWWPSIPEAYDVDGWTWAYNYYLNECTEGDYNIEDNLDGEPEDPCPDAMADATATACDNKVAELKTCCDQIGGNVCSDLLRDCKVDACAEANNDATKIEGAVDGIFGEAVEFVCDQGLDVGEAPLPILACPAGSLIETDGENDYNDISGSGLTASDERFDTASIEECEEKCAALHGCKAFSYAPIGGDNIHPDNTVCSLYSAIIPTRQHGENGLSSQVFCVLQGTCSLNSISLADDLTKIEVSQDGGNSYSEVFNGGSWDAMDKQNIADVSENTVIRYTATNGGGPGGFVAEIVITSDSDTTKMTRYVTSDNMQSTPFSIVSSTSDATKLARYYLGCYKDTHSRALRYGPQSYGYTEETCSDACSEYQYFSLQNNGQCFCDNDYDHAIKYGAVTTCPSNRMGASWANDVFQNNKQFVPYPDNMWRKFHDGWKFTDIPDDAWVNMISENSHTVYQIDLGDVKSELHKLGCIKFSETTTTTTTTTSAPGTTDTSSCQAGWGQCGGHDYKGPTCCKIGYECIRDSEWYSQCRPTPKEEDCAAAWAKCGGVDWDGPTCCRSGYHCVKDSEWYSQCKPIAVAGANNKEFINGESVPNMMENFEYFNNNNMGLLIGSFAVLFACIIGLYYRKNKNDGYKSLDDNKKEDDYYKPIKLYSTFEQV